MTKPIPKTHHIINYSRHNKEFKNCEIDLFFDLNNTQYTKLQDKQERNQAYSNTATQYCLIFKILENKHNNAAQLKIENIKEQSHTILLVHCYYFGFLKN